MFSHRSKVNRDLASGKTPTMTAGSCRWIVGLTFLLGVATSGCQDESLPFAGHQVIVQVSDVLDGTPTVGIELILMDPDRNLPLSEPVLSDPQGQARFADLTPGRYVVLAYPRDGHGIDHQPDPFFLTGTGAPAKASLQPAPTAPQTSPAQIHQVDIHTFRNSAFNEDLPRIAGEVVDADTGLPLGGAFIGMPSQVTAYLGALGVDDDVTDAAGRFRVSNIPFTIDPDTENIFQVLPLVVVREGYIPAVWFHEPANGDNNLDITGARIDMSPLTAGDTGRVRGRVTRLGEPAAGVSVALAPVRNFNAKYADGDKMTAQSKRGQQDPGDSSPLIPRSEIGQPGLVAITDSHGIFSFAEVPAGGYLVHPGFRSDDSFVFVQQGGSQFLWVAPGAVTLTDPFTVVTAIHPLAPSPGGIVDEPVQVFQWSAVEGAVRYRVYVDQRNLNTVSGTELRLPPEQAIGSGRHFWSVIAVDAAETTVGRMEQDYRFTILTR